MKLTIKLAVAALVATALSAPPALAGKSHLAGSYKVEEHIDLEGEESTYTISCPGNDIAVDGMWRLDNVDQDNDYVYDPAPTGQARNDVLLSVEPVAAYPSSVSTYTFEFAPQAGGNAQGKLFLTCLPKTVDRNGGHTHPWSTSGVQATSGAGDLVVGAPASPDTYTNTGTVTPGTACPPGTIAIAPGFKFDPDSPPATSDQWGKPYQRYPTSNALTGWRQWKWGFFSGVGGTVRFYWNCLSKTTGVPVPGPGNHVHKVAVQRKLNSSPANSLVEPDQVSEVSVICGTQYKAMLGAWDFRYGGGTPYAWTGAGDDYWKKLWYQGMDPRPRTRAFKILNTHPTTGSTIGTDADLASLCFKTKTT